MKLTKNKQIRAAARVKVFSSHAFPETRVFLIFVGLKFMNHYVRDVGDPHTFCTRAKKSNKISTKISIYLSKRSVQLQWKTWIGQSSKFIQKKLFGGSANINISCYIPWFINFSNFQTKGMICFVGNSFGITDSLFDLNSIL